MAVLGVVLFVLFTVFCAFVGAFAAVLSTAWLRGRKK